MEVLFQNKFPVPVPISNNRHAILMSFINGFPLQKVKSIAQPEIGYNTLLDLVERFAKNGLIHSDFNEFNIMIDKSQKIFIIDFPQMVSTTHRGRVDKMRTFTLRGTGTASTLFSRGGSSLTGTGCQI